MSNYFTSGIDAVVVDLGRQIDIIRKDDSLRASPGTEKFMDLFSRLREEVGKTEARAIDVESLLTTLIDDTCSLEAVSVESEQYTPQEAAARYETRDGVARLKREFAEDSTAPGLGWCPECFKGGNMNPLQEIEVSRHIYVGPASVLYCSNLVCAFNGNKVRALLDKRAELYRAPF